MSYIAPGNNILVLLEYNPDYNLVFALTQSGLHRVDDVREAVSVERVGATAAVKTRVDAQHGVV